MALDAFLTHCRLADGRLVDIGIAGGRIAKAFNDFAIVLGPPIPTTQSTPRPSVSSRAFSSQSGVSEIIDHLGGPQRLEPLGLFRGRGRRDHPSAQDPDELQRKDRNAARTLRQDRVAGGHSTVSGQRHPGGHRGPRQGRGFLNPNSPTRRRSRIRGANSGSLATLR
jgi:hypothetical protein